MVRACVRACVRKRDSERGGEYVFTNLNRSKLI
jgi:hypothetical protein